MPLPGRRDYDLDIGILRIPAQDLACLGARGDELCRVARTALAHFHLDILARGLFGRFDHFLDGKALAVAEIENIAVAAPAQVVEREHMRMDIPAFKSGDTVKVHLRIVEGEKQRIQVFQGNVIRIKRGTTNATFTVRKVSDGVGVERIFPMNSPFIDRVELVTQGRVRRSRLYYLRALKGKAARIKPRGRF